MRILVIEDDEVVSDYIVQGLKEEGHTVDAAADGKDGLFMAMSESYDVLIVDRMLPEVDGLKIIRTLRASDDATPILILSALADVEERVKGLKSGADDYLVKPFAFSELQARVEVLQRRATNVRGSDTAVLEVGDLKLDLLSREAERAGKKISLKPREFRLLEYLMRHAGQVVTRTMLLEQVWDYYFDPRTNIIDVHVSRLRGKIDKDFDEPLIHTVRGSGYVIRTDN